MVSLGQVVRGNQRYWVIDDLMASPQSIKNFPLEITRLAVEYKEQEGSLAMLLDIEFKLSNQTLDVALNTGAASGLTESARQAIGSVLSANGVQPNFSWKHTWVSSQVLPATAPALGRQFLLINRNGTLEVSRRSANADQVVQDIDDPGMDAFGQADWEVIANDSEFTQPLQ